MSFGDQMSSWVRNHRSAGVRDERDRLTGDEASQERCCFCPLVVLVKARRARRDGVVLEEARGPASILRRDQGDFAKHAKGP